MAQMVFKRYEIKYRLTDAQRKRLERVMAAHMVPDKYGPSTVRNIYFDTPTRLLARRSAEHPLYKEKIRIRSYGPATEASPVFLELKKKCEGIVYKRRCTLPLGEALGLLCGTREPQTQIEREIAFAAGRYQGLAPAMMVAYDREAYYAADDHEFRMTFDRAVRCRWEDVRLASDTQGHLLTPEGTSLLEVKCAAGMPLWLPLCRGHLQGAFLKVWRRRAPRAATAARERSCPARPCPQAALPHPGDQGKSRSGRRPSGARIAKGMKPCSIRSSQPSTRPPRRSHPSTFCRL